MPIIIYNDGSDHVSLLEYLQFRPEIQEKYLYWQQESLETKKYDCKGTCQKRFSGFCPLRGGGGYPPFPLSFFEHNDCPLRGEGPPPILLRKIPLKTGFLGPKTLFVAFFHIFLALFWYTIWPFWSIFNPI